jgi:histidyl-tRNA synthetase
MTDELKDKLKAPLRPELQETVKELMTEMKLTPSQQEVVDKIRALRKMTATSGFKTTRSVNDLLERLNADDLAAVASVLYSK